MDAAVASRTGTTVDFAGNPGQAMHDLATELFPICRSITGNGVRKTLDILARELPELKTFEVPSGTTCFDWTVPPEWNIRDAYIIDPAGRKIVDFKVNNLHVVGYSTPVEATLSLDELRPHLYSLPDQPDAIPYITSYYKERWGFCLTHRQLQALQPGDYSVKIDSTLAPGNLTYAELLIPGAEESEVFLSTYVCHPSMGNNELSGPVVTTALARWLQTLPERRYSYRIVFIPETIGSIVYLSRNLDLLKQRVIAGFNVTCIGDDRAYSYLPTRLGGTLADRTALHALKHHAGEFERYSYLDRGSDERQYCSPGSDLPVASIMRSKYAMYPEYHTSKDDLSLITPSGLAGGFEALRKAVRAVEANAVFRATTPCEPNLGKRGLYPTLSTKDTARQMRAMMTVLAYADGRHDLLSVADMLAVPVWDLAPIAAKLHEHGLLERLNRINEGPVHAR
jgi:aminopeptidase-like protein